MIRHPARRTTSIAAILVTATAGGAIVAAPAIADDGLTAKQARAVQRTALHAQSGTVIGIDRDSEKGRVRLSATVLTPGSRFREIEMTRRRHIVGRRAGDRVRGLTYRQARRAKSAARKCTSGIVTGVDTESGGDHRYEVDVLRSNNAEYQVHLRKGYSVVRVVRQHDDD